MARRGKTGSSTTMEKVTVILPDDIVKDRSEVRRAKSKLNRPDCGTWIVPKQKPQ